MIIETDFFHTGLTVTNVDLAKDFFCAVFDLPVTAERSLEGDYLSRMLRHPDALKARIVMLQTGESTFLELVEYHDPSGSLPAKSTATVITENGSPHFAFFVSDLERFHSKFVPKFLYPLAIDHDVIPGGPYAGGLIRFYQANFGCLIEIIQKPIGT